MVRIALFAIVVAFATQAMADPFKPSFAQQVQLGQDAAKEIRKKEKVLPDTDLRVVFLRTMAGKFTAQIDAKELKAKPYKWSFDVIESKEVNAFALPGGAVFFYTALLEKMGSQDEMAAVLGHEMTHVREEHWASDYAAAQRRKVGLVIGDIIGVPRTVLTIANLADDLLLGPKYSRGSEDRADKGGYNSMVAAGYNPQGAVDLFDTLDKMSKGNKPPEIFNSHPDDKKRREKMVKRMKDAEAKGAKWPAKTPLPFAKAASERLPAGKQ